MMLFKCNRLWVGLLFVGVVLVATSSATAVGIEVQDSEDAKEGLDDDMEESVAEKRSADTKKSTRLTSKELLQERNIQVPKNLLVSADDAGFKISHYLQERLNRLLARLTERALLADLLTAHKNLKGRMGEQLDPDVLEKVQSKILDMIKGSRSRLQKMKAEDSTDLDRYTDGKLLVNIAEQMVLDRMDLEEKENQGVAQNIGRKMARALRNLTSSQTFQMAFWASVVMVAALFALVFGIFSWRALKKSASYQNFSDDEEASHSSSSGGSSSGFLESR